MKKLMIKNKIKILTLIVVSVILNCLPIYAEKITLLKLYRNKMTLIAYGENNEVIKTFAVSCNKKRTPLGTRSTTEKIRWHKLYGDNNYGQYCVRYGTYKDGENLLLHSVLFSEKYNPLSLRKFYNKDGSINHNTYNGIIDKKESGGCIRLRVCDAKWLYDNLHYKTTFIIEDTDEDIPRPKYERIPDDSLCDPTDIELANLLINGCDLETIKLYEQGLWPPSTPSQIK